MKKTYQKWGDLDRIYLITHWKKWKMSRTDLLIEKLSHRSRGSVFMELVKFDTWMNTGVMEVRGFTRFSRDRAGTREIYTRLLNDLYL